MEKGEKLGSTQQLTSVTSFCIAFVSSKLRIFFLEKKGGKARVVEKGEKLASAQLTRCPLRIENKLVTKKKVTAQQRRVIWMTRAFVLCQGSQQGQSIGLYLSFSGLVNEFHE